MEASIKMVRKHKVTGMIEDRGKGRPNPNYTYGWIDDKNEFHEGHPLGDKVPKAKALATRSATSSVMQEIEKMVTAQMNEKFNKAQRAAIDAFNKTLTSL